MPAVLSASGRGASLATVPSGTRRARASSSRTSGAAGRLAVVPANSMCWWSCWLAVVRGRCCTLPLYFAAPSQRHPQRRSQADCLLSGRTPRRQCPAALEWPRDRPHLSGDGPVPWPGSLPGPWFWPECFRRLDVKGGRRSFPEETRSALDIEGKHVTIQGPSPELSPATTIASPPARPRRRARRRR
jgi:hypothetical protein